MDKVKSFSSKIDDIKKEGIVTIAISKFDVRDSADDIVRKGAFKKTFSEQADRIKHVINHSWDVTDVIGYPVKMWEGDEYAMVESRLALETQKARDVFALYKHFAEGGKTLEHSYAYKVVKRNANDDISGEDIAELAMREYSTVTWGCNKHTPLLGLKSDRMTALVEELNDILKSCNISDAAGRRIEQLVKELQRHSPDEPAGPLKKNEPTLSADELKSIFTKTLLN